MSEVSRPWENKRAGLQKVGEQKKCHGFQLQNNGSGRETEQRGTERECLLIILYTSKSEVDLYKIACYCNAHTGSNVILLILSMLDYFTLSLLTLKCQIPEKKILFFPHFFVPLGNNNNKINYFSTDHSIFFNC